MGLRFKFNVVFFGIMLIVAVLVYNTHRQDQAALSALENERMAALIFQAAESVRHYNQTELLPLLEQLDGGFLPQTVGSYAATQVFKNLHEERPEYSYQVAIKGSEVALYQPNVWQNRLIDHFVENPELPLFTQHLADAQGPFFAYAKPIKNQQQVMGAKIVRVDLSAMQSASKKHRHRFAVFLLMLVLAAMALLNVMLHILILKPLKLMAEQAELISQGRADVDEIEVHGQGEISQFGHAFNRLQRSLKAAMSLLS